MMSGAAMIVPPRSSAATLRMAGACSELSDFEELPQNLYGSALASALARVDAYHGRNALIVADLSIDPTYAEVLYETFGPRVIGVHITRHGNGKTFEPRQVKGGWVPVYPIGRTICSTYS